MSDTRDTSMFVSLGAFNAGDFFKTAWVVRRPCLCGDRRCSGIQQVLFLLWRRGLERRLTIVEGIDVDTALLDDAMPDDAVALLVRTQIERRERAYVRRGGDVSRQQIVKLDIESRDPAAVNQKIAIVGLGRLEKLSGR